MIVADSSALLAAIMEEPGGYAFIDRAGGGSVSSVNWCEVGTRLSDKGLDPRLFYTLAARLACAAFHSIRLKPIWRPICAQRRVIWDYRLATVPVWRLARRSACPWLQPDRKSVV